MLTQGACITRKTPDPKIEGFRVCVVGNREKNSLPSTHNYVGVYPLLSNQGSTFVPRTFKNLESQSGWAGQAGAVTRFPST